jgi:hypothetical protein
VIEPLTQCSYLVVRDGDPTACKLADRHYSREKNNNRGYPRFIGPGRRLALLGREGDWLFAWRISKFRMDGQVGVECTIFRNESSRLSSSIIIECELVADATFGPLRKYTYVRPSAIRSTNPGYCFQLAGWTKCGRSASGLVLLEKVPA